MQTPDQRFALVDPLCWTAGAPASRSGALKWARWLGTRTSR